MSVGSETWLAMVELLSHMPDVVHRLAVEHRSDGVGYCNSMSCRRPGYGTADREYPCSISRLAMAATAKQSERGKRLTSIAEVVPLRQDAV